MPYELTFEEVVKKTLFEGNKGMFQGENFKRGCYLQADNDVLSLYEYLLDDSICPEFMGSPIFSRGLLTQRYREVFTKQDLFEK